MATNVQVQRSGTWEDIDFRNFKIVVPTSKISVAPTATVETQARESIQANQEFRIQIDGTTRFEGVTESPGEVRSNGQVKLSAIHDADALFSERVDVSLTGTVTATDVLSTALSNANRGGNFTLDYSGTDTTLDGDYEVSNRQLTQVFRDMTDRTSRVWWVDPAGSTIHVEPPGNRGLWQSLDAQSDGAGVRSFDEGSVKTVRNDVTVTVTGGEAVSATATDATSISDYGRQSESVNIKYAATSAEAQSYADELLIPDPLASATVVVPASVGTTEQPLANYTIDLSDSTKDIDETDLVVGKQTIEQGRVTLKVGEGAGVSLENVNRNAKSQSDETEPGTVYGNDRIGTNSVDSDELVDTAVIESKLADLSVATAKLQDNAIINGKLDDLSVSETKIQDDSIATPKLQAEAVTASEIEADTITASEIAAGTITALEIAADTITAEEITSDTITALEIASDTITANEIDVGTITATEIAADTIDTGQIAAGAIKSDEIESNTITADKIDTLDLDTGEFSVTDPDDSTSGLEIVLDDFGNVDLTALTGADVDMGRGERIARIFARAGNFTSGIQVGDTGITTPAGGQAFFKPSAASGQINITTEDGVVSNSDAAIVPNTDDDGMLGSGDGTNSTKAWQEIHTHNLYQYSPQPATDVSGDGPADLDKLTSVSWYDPPAYVSQSKTKDGGHKPLDGSGVELGHMANYLLETCKAQQERINDLETRLEQLEAQVGGGNA